MKKLILLVALLTLVAFVSGVMAQEKPKPTPGKVAAALGKFAGVIAKVDEAAKAIDVKMKAGKEEKTMTFTIGDTTKITKAGKDTPFSDLKAGMAVSVDYKKEGDKNIAATIKVAAPKAPAKKEEPKK